MLRYYSGVKVLLHATPVLLPSHRRETIVISRILTGDKGIAIGRILTGDIGTAIGGIGVWHKRNILARKRDILFAREPPCPTGWYKGIS
jgi:hypothetical protein